MINEKGINAAIIGAGDRGMIYLHLCLSGTRKNVSVKALADPFFDMMKHRADTIYEDKSVEYPALYANYREMLDKEDVDVVFISSSDATHREVLMEVASREKHVLIEKPLATEIDDCIHMYRETKEYKKIIKLGFVLRYTEFYRKIKEIIKKGELGKIISIEAKEVLGVSHAASYYRRWHKYRKNTGGFLNTKCCHDIDMLNWLVNEEPAYISAFGSRIFFTEKGEAALKCKECALKYDCRYYEEEIPPGHPEYYWRMQKGECVFNTEKDIVDHEILAMEYKSGVTATFSANLFGNRDRRTMVINGSDATLTADFSESVIRVDDIYPGHNRTYNIEKGKGGHGGGDIVLFNNFIDSVRSYNGTGDNEVRQGMVSSIAALLGEKCMDEKKVFEMRKFLPL